MAPPQECSSKYPGHPRSIAHALKTRRDDLGPWLVIHEGRSQHARSWAQVHALASRWAHALHTRGVSPENRVLILAPNGLTFIGAFLGAQLLGATAVPLAWPFFPEPTARRQQRLSSILRVTRPRCVVTVDGQAEGWPCPVVTAPSDTPYSADAPGAAAGPAFLQFTSGTTGDPKGAAISARAAVYNAWAIGRRLELGPSDVGVSWLPLFHDMGLVGALLTSLVRGFPLHVLRPGDFLLRPRSWVSLLSDVGATLTVAPDFAYDLAVKKTRDPEALNLTSLRLALNGSEPVHRATLDRFVTHFAAAGLRQDVLRPVYGLAENTLAVAFGGPEEPDLEFEGRRVPSVGRSLEGMAVRIVAPSDAVLADGEQGEICVRGPSLMDGYFERPDLTAETIRDGWLHTGDLGVMQDGLLYVTGRIKDLVIKGGTKFHPYEIERVVSASLDTPPGGVAAFSMLEARTDAEILVVALELRSALREGAERKVRGRLAEELGLRADRVCIVRPGALPRTTSGKVRRAACAAALEAHL